jgi:hypothetical protein
MEINTQRPHLDKFIHLKVEMVQGPCAHLMSQKLKGLHLELFNSTKCEITFDKNLILFFLKHPGQNYIFVQMSTVCFKRVNKVESKYHGLRTNEYTQLMAGILLGN